jgi:hypothetical protein
MTKKVKIEIIVKNLDIENVSANEGAFMYGETYNYLNVEVRNVSFVNLYSTIGTIAQLPILYENSNFEIHDSTISNT